MGGGSWNASDWDRHSKTHIKGKTSVSGASGVFSQSGLHPALDPKGVIRESRDSQDNPLSTPIAIALDVTGSMGGIAKVIAEKGLPLLAEEIYSRKPVTNPHIMFMGVGDVESDRVPFQATQFEADIRIAEQLQKLFMEGNGGGNGFESYSLPYYFCAKHVVTDHNEKRQKRGVLFTVGDERPNYSIGKEHIKRIFGDDVEENVTMEESIRMVTSKFDVFHILIAEGHNMRYYADETTKQWKDLLGERVIILSDYTKLAEVIVSILQVHAGQSVDSVVNSWSDSTALVVAKAVSSLVTTSGDTGLVEL